MRQHPWRNAAAVVSVMLGVALAFSVHLINASALDEFAQALRSVGGKPDLELRSNTGTSPESGTGLNHALLGLLIRHPDVAIASPVLELSTYALAAQPDQKRVLLRIVGVDALQVASLAPDLMPQPDPDGERLDFFSPDTVFLNAKARELLTGNTLRVQQGLQLKTVGVAGRVSAGGAPLAVMDIAAVQDLFDRNGSITRIDLRLQAGTDRARFVRELTTSPGWPPGARVEEPGEGSERIGKLSRAYRTNLTVLALVALFTGGFLVFSVLALSVTRRAQSLALLGVLGLTANQRMALVLLEATALGLVGSTLGLALGTGLAALALQLLGGDLGGGFFAGSTPKLQWSAVAALVFGGLGLLASLMGAWWPARMAQRLPPAQTLKGLGATDTATQTHWWSLALLMLGGVMALLPPLWDMPIAAYFSVGLLLLGGITALPWLVGTILNRLAPLAGRHALSLLALERARRVRESATVAVGGVVASLSLAVALTVMVASFRTSVMHWLDNVLPATLYVRTAGSGSASDNAYFDSSFVRAAQRLQGIERITTQRTLSFLLDSERPPVTLLARPLRDSVSGDITLPLVAAALPVPAGRVGLYVSEAVVDLYGVKPGDDFSAFQASFLAVAPASKAQGASFFIAGVWRDYARQFGTVAMEQADFERLSDDRRINDMAFWLTPDTDSAQVQQALRDLASQQAGTPGGEAGALLEFGSAAEIRATSLRIFDRSFAVTYWLQAVAIGIGLFGVAASFSAQVLARRKEFGLLAHLGLTRRQILRVVAAEGAAWTTLGALVGVALGLVVAVVLVHVVNPQSFHWTMELNAPWLKLLGLGLAVILAGTATAWLSGRAAASKNAVLAVKEDW